MHQIKRWIHEAKTKKHCCFDDLNRIVKRILTRYGYLFPRYKKTSSGSKTVHHFNVPDVYPISLEKEHGSREFIPPRYKKLALDGLEALVQYIEATEPARLQGLAADDGQENVEGNDDVNRD